MCDFRDAKVGDKVWSIRHGWGVIESEYITGFKVRYGDYSSSLSHLGAEYLSDKNPTVFWDEVKIVPPPKPKRKVKKVIEGWVYFFKSSNSDCLIVGGSGMEPQLYETREGAEEVRGSNGPPVIFIRHEYEVQE